MRPRELGVAALREGKNWILVWECTCILTGNIIVFFFSKFC